MKAMKKQYMVPSMMVVEFDSMDVIVTSDGVDYHGGNGNGGPTVISAPNRRNAIWDE